MKFLLYRLEFPARENLREPKEFFLTDLSSDSSIPEILEMTGKFYGGGAFRLDLKHYDRVLFSQPFEITGEPKEPPRTRIFKPVSDHWYDETSDTFSEEVYAQYMAEFIEHGVDDFLDFLHKFLCTRDAANRFLVECLHKAQDYGWDT